MNTIHDRSLWTASALLLLAALPAAQQRMRNVREIQVPGKDSVARVWFENGTPHYSLSLDGKKFQPATETSYELKLRFEEFDPRKKAADVPATLIAGPDNRLFVVQYWTQGIEDYRDLVRAQGGEIHRFLANNSNVVELDPDAAERVEALPFVRSVTPFHPAFKLEPELVRAVQSGAEGKLQVQLLTTRRGGFSTVGPWIEERGGTFWGTHEQSYLFAAELGLEDLAALAAHNEVAWVEEFLPLPKEEWTDTLVGPVPPSAMRRMNVARMLHGSDYVESMGGYRGQGVRFQDWDIGCQQGHPDIPNFLLHGAVSNGTHGTATTGIVCGKGIGNANATGCMPDAFPILADIDTNPIAGGSRYGNIGELQNPGLPYKCVFQTSSVSFTRTLSYNATSQETDTILFDFDHFSMFQSQSNAGSQQSRPEAWAKNIVAVGGISHFNTLTKSDDRYTSASRGPAADGRIKPDMASFYDAILTTTWNSGYTANFGGTSGATPIIAGHAGLFIDMWSNQEFGNTVPGTTPFQNAPNNTTTKAALINTADQWDFSMAGTSNPPDRVRQGWGHADLQYMWDNKDTMLIVDETDVLELFDATTYYVNVGAGEDEFRATMVYRDPPGTTSSTLHRINNLDLVALAPNGTVYKGNHGMLDGNFTTPGGQTNKVDTVENVFVENPVAGEWRVIVMAADVNQDSHVETGAVDVDYALVVSGIDTVGPACDIASVSKRTPAQNPNVLDATDPVVGQNVTFSCDTQGKQFGQIIGTALPEFRLTDSGNFALVSPETQVFVTPRIAGPNFQTDVLVAPDPSMCGMTIFCQARLDDGPGTPFLLTNSVDLKVGN